MTPRQLARLQDYAAILLLGIVFGGVLDFGLEVVAGQARISTGEVVLR